MTPPLTLQALVALGSTFPTVTVTTGIFVIVLTVVVKIVGFNFVTVGVGNVTV